MLNSIYSVFFMDKTHKIAVFIWFLCVFRDKIYSIDSIVKIYCAKKLPKFTVPNLYGG